MAVDHLPIPIELTSRTVEREPDRSSMRGDQRERYERTADAIAGLGHPHSLRGLDAFCGDGAGTRLLADRLGAEVAGIDPRPDAIALAEDLADERTRFSAVDAALELPESGFDFVTCFESIERVDADLPFLARLAKALVPGGLLFLSTPNEDALPLALNGDYFRHHQRHYRDLEIETLAASVGLALRYAAGQDTHRTLGRRAEQPLADAESRLRDDLECPQFHWQVFERIAEPKAPADAAPSPGAVRLDLGCGERGPRPGFRGVDIRALPGVETVARMTELEAHYAPESVDEIASRHAFEHLTFHDGAEAVAGWSRVLKPGGKLQLTVPDLRYHIEQFLDPRSERPLPDQPRVERTRACPRRVLGLAARAGNRLGHPQVGLRLRGAPRALDGTRIRRRRAAGRPPLEPQRGRLAPRELKPGTARATTRRRSAGRGALRLQGPETRSELFGHGAAERGVDLGVGGFPDRQGPSEHSTSLWRQTDPPPAAVIRVDGNGDQPAGIEGFEHGGQAGAIHPEQAGHRRHRTRLGEIQPSQEGELTVGDPERSERRIEAASDRPGRAAGVKTQAGITHLECPLERNRTHH